jgi:hypothetical protein
MVPANTAAMESCPERSSREGTQTQPTALVSMKRLKEGEGFILDRNQKRQVPAMPDRTAATTYAKAVRKTGPSETE